MDIIPFGITTLRKETTYRTIKRHYWWLDLDPAVPKRLGWKDNQYLITTLTKNRDVLVQPFTTKLLYALLSNSKNHVRTSLLRPPWSPETRHYIDIEEALIQKINPKRGQPFALTGMSKGRLLIIKLPLKNPT